MCQELKRACFVADVLPALRCVPQSGYFPAFAPFSQLHAAIVMAAITGSFDYATSLRSGRPDWMSSG